MEMYGEKGDVPNTSLTFCVRFLLWILKSPHVNTNALWFLSDSTEKETSNRNDIPNLNTFNFLTLLREKVFL